MYSNSKGQIKLAGYLNKCFDINKGTEQGHPLSPDLFKHYLGGLSSLLEFENCPQLASLIISHLLWADDLIMLSLDNETAQKQLDALHNFCNKWALEINMDKTKVMITGHEPKGLIKPNCKLGNMNVKYTDEYCYLGLVLNKSGSLKTAQTTLKTKAMRAFFGLKGTVNKSKISFRAQTTLFDSLIKPITLYGAPIWLPTFSIIKNTSSLIINNRLVNSHTFKFTNRVSQMPCEKVHLSFSKWSLGVHRKASNIGTWGESGRYPLLYQSIKLTLKYYQRIDNMKTASIVKAALQEQKIMNLSWYKNIKTLLKLDNLYHMDHVSAFKYLHQETDITTDSSQHSNHINNSQLNKYKHLKPINPISCKKYRIEPIMKSLKDHFKSIWEQEKKDSAKLFLFYNNIKLHFKKEP